MISGPGGRRSTGPCKVQCSLGSSANANFWYTLPYHGHQSSVDCLVACAAFLPFVALAGLCMFGLAVLRVPACLMLSPCSHTESHFAYLIVAIGPLEHSAVAG